MGKRIVWPVSQIREWIEDGATQAWIGNQLHYLCPNTSRPDKLIQKVCRKHNIHCQRSGPRSGAGHPEWRGGKRIDKDGYVLIYNPLHPYAPGSRKTYVREHRLVMEQHLGRYLKPGEVVHHKNHDKQDNRIENLELFERNSDHLRHELTGKCPKWTEDGKARIAQACKKGLSKCNPYSSELDEQELIQKLSR